MLIFECFGSMSIRLSLAGQRRFFFKPVQLYFKLSYLLIQTGNEFLILLLFPLPLLLDENISGKPSKSCLFHLVSILGCNPYSEATSFTVRNPLTSSSATLA